MASDFATEIAAQVWCQPSLSHKVMDVDIALAFADILDRYIEALQWCGGSADFGFGGQARLGWERAVEPLIRAPKAQEDARLTSTNNERDEICPLWDEAKLCAWPKCNRLCGVSACVNQRGKLSPVA